MMNEANHNIDQSVNVPAMIFYFVRHGQTNWGRDDILKGPQNLPLNAVGIEQARKAGVSLKEKLTYEDGDIALVTSSLKRAQETAEKISSIIHVPIAYEEQELRERYYGDYRLTQDLFVPPADAESDPIFRKRVVDILDKLLDKHQHEVLIIVSHQKVFECVCELLTSQKHRLSQGGVARFTLNHANQWEVEIIEC